jgi:hypothetical protein
MGISTFFSRLLGSKGEKTSLNKMKTMLGRIRSDHSRSGRRTRIESLEPRCVLSGSTVVHLASHPTVGTAAGTSVVLSPTADAPVYGPTPYTNYGNTTDLLVQNDSHSWTTDDAESYLRFNLAGVGAVSKAVLQLTPLSLGRSVSSLVIGIEALAAGDDTGWVEGSGGNNYSSSGPITWYNSPNGAGTLVSLAGSQLAVDQAVSIDVTSLLSQNINTPGTFSLIIGAISNYGRNQYADFASRENGTAAYRPELILTTAGPAAPPPTVAQQPATSNQTATTVQLSALGSDGGSDVNLIYNWSATTPAGAAAPIFSANGSNGAKNTTVTFHQAGTYTFTAMINNTADGLSVTTNSVTVTVAQTLSGLQISPSSVVLALGGSQTFAAAGVDQFGQPMSAALGSMTWTESGPGSFFTANDTTASDTYVAPTTKPAATSATVTVSGGGYSATATVTLSTGYLGLKDPVLANLVQSLDTTDGAITRNDMLAILRDVETLNGGVLSATDMSDLKTILSDAATLKIPGYVQVLASDVINGNTANAHYQGQTLGNLAVGSSATQLNELVDKWFLGTDLPSTGGYTYTTVSGPLYSASGPSHLDEDQGYLGDCYLISSLGSVADSNPAAIQNMIVDNGVDPVTGLHTWTVRFYVNGKADYVTVDNQLPTSGGTLIFDGYGHGATNPPGLWIALIEKAYAQWNETGNEGRDGTNSYSAIAGGWMADVYAQVLGHSASSYNMTSSSDQQALISAMTSKMAVSIGTDNGNVLAYGLYGGHAYAVTSYNASNGTFTLYNPWGSNQPTQPLTWAQLQTVCAGFATASTSGTTSFAASLVSPRVVAPVIPAAGAALSTTSGASASSSPATLSAAAVDALFAAEAAQPMAVAGDASIPLVLGGLAFDDAGFDVSAVSPFATNAGDVPAELSSDEPVADAVAS